MPTNSPTDPPKAAPIDRRAERRKAIDDADMPDSVKLLLQLTQDHSDDELDVYRDGFGRMDLHAAQQTKIQASFGILLVLGILALAGVQVTYGGTDAGTLTLASPAAAATGPILAPAVVSAPVEPVGVSPGIPATDAPHGGAGGPEVVTIDPATVED
jgi:hypothetical protein